VSALFAILSLALPAAAGGAAPRLEVAGNDLIDSRTGLTFVPRGVNWPSFEYACHDGYGYSNSATPTSVGPTAAGAAAIARWHINTVRLPLNQDCWLGEDGLPRFGTTRGYRTAVRRWVAKLHRAGLAVIVDLHWSGPAGLVADGLRALPDDRSDDFWRSVARAFKRDRSMIFDVFNEPYERYGPNGLVFDLTWECWRTGGCDAPRPSLLQPLDGTTYQTIGMYQLVEAIRSTGAKQPILLPGRHFANDLRGWAANRPADGQLVASFHNYNFQPCNTTACWDETVAPIAERFPVVAGEFGQTKCDVSHVRRFMRWADRRAVGYLMWAWWLLPQRGCGSLAMLADAKGRPRRPNGTAFKAHLNRLAPRLELAAARSQPLDRAVEVRALCQAACRVQAGGNLRVGGASVRLVPARRSLPAGEARLLSIAIPGTARQPIILALRRGERVSARIRVVASDGSHSRTRRAKVSMRLGGARLG
jgi:hypothetical protein